MPEDELALLTRLNKSELIQMARAAGLGNLGRNLSRRKIAEALVGAEAGEIEQDALQEWRELMEAHIDKNRKRLLSQLPGCTGCCTTFGCPDVIVARCWDGFSRDML